jgi:hypothetical protein
MKQNTVGGGVQFFIVLSHIRITLRGNTVMVENSMEIFFWIQWFSYIRN